MDFRNIPRITKYLLIINVIVFVFTDFISKGELRGFLSMKYFQNPDFGPWQIITSMFTHGGMGHLFFNMFALFMFGSALERVWGEKRFLTLYFVAGIGAVLLQQGVYYFQVQEALSHLPADALNSIKFDGSMISYPNDANVDSWLKLARNYYTSSVGASGAIFGILVAFGMLFPNTEFMLMFIPVPVKAKYFIPIYIIAELFMGISNFSGDNIAHFAHLGGALAGFIFVQIWKKDRTVFY